MTRVLPMRKTSLLPLVAGIGAVVGVSARCPAAQAQTTVPVVSGNGIIPCDPVSGPGYNWPYFSLSTTAPTVPSAQYSRFGFSDTVPPGPSGATFAIYDKNGYDVSASWGVRPVFCDPNDPNAAPVGLAIFPGREGGAGGPYRVEFQEQYGYVPGPVSYRYISATFSLGQIFSLTAPANLQVSIGYVPGRFNANDKPTFPQRYNFYPIVSWSPPVSSRLATLTVSDPTSSGGLGFPTTPTDIYDIVGTGGTNASPTDIVRYAYDEYQRQRLNNGMSYTFSVKSRTKTAWGPSASVTATMPRYPDIVRGTTKAIVSEIPGYEKATYLPPMPSSAGDWRTTWEIVAGLGPTGMNETDPRRYIATSDRPNGWGVVLTKQSFTMDASYTELDPVTCTPVTKTQTISGIDGVFSVTVPSTASASVPGSRPMQYRVRIRTLQSVYAVGGYQWQVVPGSEYGAPFNVVTATAQVKRAHPAISPVRLAEMKRSEGLEVMRKMALQRSLSAPCKANVEAANFKGKAHANGDNWRDIIQCSESIVTSVLHARRLL